MERPPELLLILKYAPDRSSIDSEVIDGLWKLSPNIQICDVLCYKLIPIIQLTAFIPFDAISHIFFIFKVFFKKLKSVFMVGFLAEASFGLVGP